MQNQRRNRERVAKGVGQDGGQEVGSLVTAQTHATKAAAQAHVGVAGEEGVAVEAAGSASIATEERGEVEVCLQAAAQVFSALQAPPGGSHAARAHLAAALATGCLHGAGIHVHQTGQLHIALSVSGTGAGQGSSQGDESFLHVCSLELVIRFTF